MGKMKIEIVAECKDLPKNFPMKIIESLEKQGLKILESKFKGF